MVYPNYTEYHLTVPLKTIQFNVMFVINMKLKVHPSMSKGKAQSYKIALLKSL